MVTPRRRCILWTPDDVFWHFINLNTSVSFANYSHWDRILRTPAVDGRPLIANTLTFSVLLSFYEKFGLEAGVVASQRTYVPSLLILIHVVCVHTLLFVTAAVTD